MSDADVTDKQRLNEKEEAVDEGEYRTASPVSPATPVASEGAQLAGALPWTTRTRFESMRSVINGHHRCLWQQRIYMRILG